MTKADSAYHDINELCDVPMRKRLEDLYLTLEVLKELCGKVVALDGFDSHFVSCGLFFVRDIMRKRGSAYFMISLIHRRETPFPDVRHYDVGSSIVIFGVPACRRALEG